MGVSGQGVMHADYSGGGSGSSDGTALSNGAPKPVPAALSPESLPSGGGAATDTDHHAAVPVAVSTRPTEREAPTPPAPARLVVENLEAFYGKSRAVKGASLTLLDRCVTAIIGPSGCGKSTLLRCLNRMHETVPSARATGKVMLDGQDIYDRGVNVTAVRQQIGMVFQRPTPFPTMSIRDNVAAGLNTLDHMPSPAKVDEIVERALRHAALWDEVKDRLRESALSLSGGQQQRMCIARALAILPGVLLLDEPTAALDPLSSQKVEELVYELRRDMTIVIVTHNMQQAARVSDRTAFMLLGDLVEMAPTGNLFTTPKDPRTEAYITGRFG
jgi:phosphate transport system ATP-binding protein